MFLTHLSVADFRSWPLAEVELAPGATTFTGHNGQGKTNLVEAVEYLASLGSHRVATDAPLIRVGAERALVRARVQAGRDDPRSLLVEVEINAHKANRAWLNRGPLRRPRDLLGALRVVLFSPEDLVFVKGDPAQRRRFIDELITQRWPRLAGVRADYDRVLRQRSALLKSLSGRRAPQGADAAATLDVWDGSLARLGAEIVHARLVTLRDLADGLAHAYRAIAPEKSAPQNSAAHNSAIQNSAAQDGEAQHGATGDDAAGEHTAGESAEPAADNVARVGYRSSSLGTDGEPDLFPDDPAEALAARLTERMADRRGEEIARGVSLVGPHRDDLTLWLGPLPAKGYASHGESWSLALALRLASSTVLRADGIESVLILDDVFAELDAVRRARLADEIADAEQVLITAAVPDDVPSSLQGRRYVVAGGEVRRDDDR